MTIKQENLGSFLIGKVFDTTIINKENYKYEQNISKNFFDAIEKQYAKKNNIFHSFTINTIEIPFLRKYHIIHNYECYINLVVFLQAFENFSRKNRKIIQSKYLHDIRMLLESGMPSFLENETTVLSKIIKRKNLTEKEKKSYIYENFKYYEDRLKNCKLSEDEIFYEIERINILHITMSEDEYNEQFKDFKAS